MVRALLFAMCCLRKFLRYLKNTFYLLALHSSCTSDMECVEDAQCVQRNGTAGRRCYCQEGFYEETPLFCNGKFFFFSQCKNYR